MQKITKLSAMALLGISLISLNANSVHAATNHVLPKAVTKIAGNKNYRIYREITKKKKKVHTRQSAILKILDMHI